MHRGLLLYLGKRVSKEPNSIVDEFHDIDQVRQYIGFPVMEQTYMTSAAQQPASLRTIPKKEDHVKKYLRIANFILQNPTMKRRFESNIITFYSNDYDTLYQFSKDLGEVDKDSAYNAIYENTLFTVHNEIEEGEVLLKSPEMKNWGYRVYMKHNAVNILQWLKTYKNKLKMGSLLERELSRYDHRLVNSSGRYFYVKNESMLTMVKLIGHHEIRKVEKVKVIDPVVNG